MESHKLCLASTCETLFLSGQTHTYLV